MSAGILLITIEGDLVGDRGDVVCTNMKCMHFIRGEVEGRME